MKPYDNYEISPCTRTEEPDKPGHFYFEVCKPNEADVWTLYGHLPEGGVEAIGDFATREAAEQTFQRITGIPFGNYEVVAKRVRVMQAGEELLKAARLAEQLCGLVTRWADAEGDDAFNIMDDIVAIAQDECLPARAIAAATGKEAV